MLQDRWIYGIIQQNALDSKGGSIVENDFRFLMYRAEDVDVSVNAVVKDESVWLTQKGMAELFACTADNISLHLKNIYEDGELIEGATTEEFSVVEMYCFYVFL